MSNPKVNRLAVASELAEWATVRGMLTRGEITHENEAWVVTNGTQTLAERAEDEYSRMYDVLEWITTEYSAGEAEDFDRLDREAFSHRFASEMAGDNEAFYMECIVVAQNIINAETVDD